MSRASSIIVLCEDKAHEVFVGRFLTKGWGLNRRNIRVIAYPSGRGSGKKHVEKRISDEVKALRSRPASTILLVVRDADEDSVDAARRTLDGKLDPPRKDSESIAYIIPKWHIQTWLAYLKGVSVDESVKYDREYGALSESKNAHPLIDDLSAKCRGARELVSPPDSLKSACLEFQRIRSSL